MSVFAQPPGVATYGGRAESGRASRAQADKAVKPIGGFADPAQQNLPTIGAEMCPVRWKRRSAGSASFGTVLAGWGP